MQKINCFWRIRNEAEDHIHLGGYGIPTKLNNVQQLDMG